MVAPLNFTASNWALVRSAPRRSASRRSAPNKSAPLSVASRRSAFRRFAAKNCHAEVCPTKVCPLQVRLIQACPSQRHPPKVCPTQIKRWSCCPSQHFVSVHLLPPDCLSLSACSTSQPQFPGRYRKAPHQSSEYTVNVLRGSPTAFRTGPRHSPACPSRTDKTDNPRRGESPGLLRGGIPCFHLSSPRT